MFMASICQRRLSLLPHKLSEEEVARYIGVDWLVYQDLEDLKECALGINPEIETFDCSVFDGQYVTGGVDRAYLERIESVRSDAAKIGQDASKEIIDLHNYQ